MIQTKTIPKPKKYDDLAHNSLSGTIKPKAPQPLSAEPLQTVLLLSADLLRVEG